MFQVTLVSTHIAWAILLSHCVPGAWPLLLWFLSCLTCARVVAAADQLVNDETFSLCVGEKENWLNHVVGIILGSYGFIGCIFWPVIEYTALLPSLADSRYVDWSWSDPLSEKLWVF